MATPIKIRLTRSFASNPLVVRLPFALPDTNYTVTAELTWDAGGAAIHGKTTKRFAVTVANPGAGTRTMTLLITWGE